MNQESDQNITQISANWRQLRHLSYTSAINYLLALIIHADAPLKIEILRSLLQRF